MGVVDFVHSDESDGDWTLVTKGGEYSPWWDDVHLMLDWADNGYRVKNFVDGKGKLRSVLRSLPKMYEACATYPYRTTSGFGMRYMPKGGSFSVGGWGVFSPENYNIFEVLAVYNTRYARTFMEILLGQGDSSVSGSAARNHVADAVGGIPFPKIKLPISVSANVQRIIELWMELHESETSFHYEAPLKFDPAGMSYENICNLAWSHRASLLKLVSGLYNNIEAAVEDSYEFDSNELAYIDEAEGQSLYSYPRSTVNKDALLAFVNMNIQDLTSFSKNKLGPARYIVKKSYFIDRHLDLFCHVYGCHIADVLDAYESISPLQTNFSADLAHKILNWIVGCLLGRWDINVLKNRLNAPIGLSGFESLLSNYESIYKERSGKEFLVHSSIKSTLVDEISECAEKVFGVKYDAIIKSMLDQVGAVSIEEYFCDPKRFFAWHLSVHSKSRRQAPVVLPLSSNQGKIIVFIHYKNLSIDLMYQVINEVIEPLISNCEEDLKTLNITEDRDKHEESLQFMEDAYDFRDCIKKLCNNWEFYPQDGAVIALSPLKNMFKNTQWVGRLTKIEIDLNAGKYDWAMLSTHYWPERVYKKCHQDRSIAIAHDVEAELWEEVEVPAARGSGTKWVWKPKEMTEAELDAYIQLKISKDKSLS
jgi:hypothetical protein